MVLDQIFGFIARTWFTSLMSFVFGIVWLGKSAPSNEFFISPAGPAKFACIMWLVALVQAVVHQPEAYGKTTMLYWLFLLLEKLAAGYATFSLVFRADIQVPGREPYVRVGTLAILLTVSGLIA